MTHPDRECKSDKTWHEFSRWFHSQLEEMTRPMNRTHVLAVVSKEVFHDIHVAAYAPARTSVAKPVYDNDIEEFETPFCRLRLKIGDTNRLRVMKFKKELG